MQKTIIGMGIATLILAATAFIQGGWEQLGIGFITGGKMLVQIAPLLILAFITAGLISVLVSQETVSRWLGEKAGWKGLFLGALAGALIPGGPYVFFPLAATFLVAGARIGTAISFVTAKNLWTLSRLPMEVALLGPHITVVRFIVTFVFPIILGALANVLFSKYHEKICEGIRKLQKSEEHN